jgi:uncharacterized protein (UPF0548 family)
MFQFTRPTAAAVRASIAAASKLPNNGPKLLSLHRGVVEGKLPFSFAYDQSRTCIGQGKEAFRLARKALERWAEFDLGWVRVANAGASIAAGQIVAVEVRSLGLWSVNINRILETIISPICFGFLYATTPLHIEQGEERFLLEFDPQSGNVWYHIDAVSRPRNPMAGLGYPITRKFQHNFARDSHRRLQQVVQAELT